MPRNRLFYLHFDEYWAQIEVFSRILENFNVVQPEIFIFKYFHSILNIRLEIQYLSEISPFLLLMPAI